MLHILTHLGENNASKNFWLTKGILTSIGNKNAQHWKEFSNINKVRNNEKKLHK